MNLVLASLSQRYIPTVTGSVSTALPVVLCSPTPKKFTRGTSLTIVDCYTFFLRSHATREKAVAHYTWLADFTYDHGQDDSLVFVVPDCDWLGQEETQRLAKLWPFDKIKNSLSVYDSYMSKFVKRPIGIALQAKQDRSKVIVPANVKWIHHFSKYYKLLKDPSLTQTYDSLSEL